MNLLKILSFVGIILSNNIFACTPPQASLSTAATNDFISQHIYPTYASEFPGSAQSGIIPSPSNHVIEADTQSNSDLEARANPCITAAMVGFFRTPSQCASLSTHTNSAGRIKICHLITPDYIPEQ